MSPRLAKPREGARAAMRGARGANGGSKLHHRLIPSAGVTAIEQKLSVCLYIGDIIIEQSDDYAPDITVDSGVGQAEGDAGDRRGGVVSDAGKRSNRIENTWKMIDFCHFFSCFVHVSRTAIIAQSAPHGEDLLLVGGRQRSGIRERTQESFVIRYYGGDARLLEHDFRDPDGVGIARTAPWEVAAVAIVPARECRAYGPMESGI